jgi:hypothetical protein
LGKNRLTYTSWYASGDDSDCDDKFDAFVSTDFDRFDSVVLFEGGYTDDNYGTERPYILNKGLFLNKLAFDQQATKKLKFGGAGLYLMTAEDITYIDDNGKSQANKDLGFEFDAYISYKLYENVELALNGGYLIAGDAMPATDLLFTLTSTLLEVRDTTGRIVHSYAVQPAANALSAATTLQPSVAQEIPAPVKSGLKWEKTAVEMGSNVRYDNDASGYKLLGILPTSTLMADFVATQSGLLPATTDGNSINVYQGQGDLPLIASYSADSVERIHALNWWQPSVTGPL